jgi:hypothetical protein
MRVRAAAVAPSVAVLSMVVFGSFGSAGAAAAARAALTPAAGLLDGQSVVVSGAGFDPDVQVGMAECLTGTVGTAECDPAGVHFTTTDGSGSFSTPVRVTRVINVAGSLTDCATPGACVLGLQETPDPAVTATVAISFADVPIPAPSVKVSPSIDLADQQEVQVAGLGFTPGATVALLECPFGSTVVSACDLSTILITTADPTGAIAAAYRVVRVITANGASLDCAAPSGCQLSAGNVDDFDQRTLVPIAFANLPVPSPGAPAPVGPPASPIGAAPVATLAMTGTTPGPLVALGGGLLAGGLVAMLAATGFGRRRRAPFRADRAFGHDHVR